MWEIMLVDVSALAQDSRVKLRRMGWPETILMGL